MSKKDDGSDFPEKLLKKLPTGFTDTVEGYSTEELERQILTSEKALSETETEMEGDDKLFAAKEEVKLLSSGYKEVIGTEKAKIKYCLHLMKNRGG